MFLVALLIAASTANVDPRAEVMSWRDRVLLAVNDEAARPDDAKDAKPEAADSKIEHSPLEKTARGEVVVIKAKVQDPSHLFAPLVFARRAGTDRYEAFTMRDKGKRGFIARLPPSILNEGSFDYFIEAQHEEGGATRLGSPRKPYNTLAYDPPPVPVPITFRTEEPGATVKVDDNDIGKTPVTVSVGPGPHTIAVATADGRSTEQQIDIKPGTRKKIDMLLSLPHDAGGPATLGVTSDPLNANVLIDGVAAGRTPYQGELAPGEHLVAVEMDGRLKQERKVVAREGRDANVSFALPPLPKDPALAVESEPIGAIVAVDGKDKGRTPWVAPLSAGPHQLVLKMEGHREVGTDFTMPKDRDLSIKLDLPVAGTSGSHLTLTSQPNGATVQIDGKELGITPWSGEMKPGNHKVGISSKGFLKEERVVPIQPNRDADVTFALNREPGPGRLHVETEPPEAVVSIDGKQVGTAPFTGDVSPGDHELEVTNEGYKTVAQQLNLEAGQQLSLKLALQQAQAGQVPPLIAVASDPMGAMLFLDGKQVGVTPIKVRSTPGPHEIKLAMDGYITRTGKPVLPDSRDFELRMSVSLKPVRGVEEKHTAPTPEELANAQVKSGHACSKQGDWECALKSYKAAYEMFGAKANPRLLILIGTMRKRMGQYKEALEAYKGYLRDAKDDDPKLKEQSRQQVASLQLKLNPPPVAAAMAIATNARLPPGTTQPAKAAEPAEEEDTDPPILTHDAVKKAVRGQPIRLLARIVDERSGVATPQACWRNIYSRDFACQPMGKVGEDQYGIEVPAKAVNDGFAYYLEAYDNNENGPARSGAPELPNSVVVEDAPAKAAPGIVNAIATDPGQAQYASAKGAPNEALQNADANFAEGKGPLATAQKQQGSNHLLSWISIGGAAAAIGTSGALYYHATNLSNSLNTVHTGTDVASIKNQINTEQTVANVLLGVTLAFGVGAVAFWNF